ncbi:MAG: DUF5615 family PIN-like protein [Candidatus Methylomirabilia bacterium]
MRFLADMSVSVRVVEWLRAGGHDAIHLREQGGFSVVLFLLRDACAVRQIEHLQ